MILNNLLGHIYKNAHNYLLFFIENLDTNIP